MITTEKIHNLLSSIGYVLHNDNNKRWRAQAIYRQGDNKTSCVIDKDTGNFHDFAVGISGSLVDLVKLTLNDNSINVESLLKNYEINRGELAIRNFKKPIVMEKTWSEKELENLLPHYKFYNDKGISSNVLQFLKSGMSHSGAMNQRYVFPIYNSAGKIHGWSGRDMTNKRKAKWKHMGRKTNWIYPVFMYNKQYYPTQEAIGKTGEIILVESIGDMLNLWEHDIKNVIVTFGTKLSSKVCSFIMAQEINQVVIATNNDIDKNINHGKVAAINMFIQLMSCIDIEKLLICLPTVNDFGEMHEKDFEQWLKKKNNVNKRLLYKALLQYLGELYTEGKLTKTQKKMGLSLKAKYEQS